MIRAATAAVTAVASFAAVVSYSHIYDLGRLTARRAPPRGFCSCRWTG
jgi:hypothetical protein